MTPNLYAIDDMDLTLSQYAIARNGEKIWKILSSSFSLNISCTFAQEMKCRALDLSWHWNRKWFVEQVMCSALYAHHHRISTWHIVLHYLADYATVLGILLIKLVAASSDPKRLAILLNKLKQQYVLPNTFHHAAQRAALHFYGRRWCSLNASCRFNPSLTMFRNASVRYIIANNASFRLAVLDVTQTVTFGHLKSFVFDRNYLADK